MDRPNRYSGRRVRTRHKPENTCVISSPSTCRTRPARSPASPGLFSTRGYNIESLSVAATDDPSVSRVTLVTKGADGVILQIVNQLNKLIDVVAVEDLTRGEHIERELVVLKLRVEPQLIDSVRGYVVRAGGRVLEPSPEGFRGGAHGIRSRGQPVRRPTWASAPTSSKWCAPARSRSGAMPGRCTLR